MVPPSHPCLMRRRNEGLALTRRSRVETCRTYLRKVRMWNRNWHENWFEPVSGVFFHFRWCPLAYGLDRGLKFSIPFAAAHRSARRSHLSSSLLWPAHNKLFVLMLRLWRIVAKKRPLTAPTTRTVRMGRAEWSVGKMWAFFMFLKWARVCQNHWMLSA